MRRAVLLILIPCLGLAASLLGTRAARAVPSGDVPRCPAATTTCLAPVPTAVRWLPIGPPGHTGQVGKIAVLAVDWAHPAVMYAASGGWSTGNPDVVPSGVYRTDDGGSSWHPMDRGLADPHVTALWVDERDGDLALAATPSGLFRTTDGGVTWTAVPSLAGAYVESVRGSATQVAAATPAGVYASSDAGASWTLAWASPFPVGFETGFSSGGEPFRPVSGVLSLASDTARICALASSSAAATAPVVACTTPSGAWATAAALPCTPTARCSAEGLWLGPSRSAEVVAHEATLDHGIATQAYLRSVDGGTTWTPLHGPVPNGSLQTLTLDPNDADRLWCAMANSPIYESTDGGAAWRAVGTVGDAREILVTPGDSRRIYATSDQGIWLSATGGHAPWLARSATIHDAMVYDVGVGGPSLLAVVQDYTPFSSSTLGRTWRAVPGSELGVALVDPGDPLIQLASTCGGSCATTFSSDGGRHFAAERATPAFRAVASSPRTPEVLDGLTLTELWQSTDWGLRWRRLAALPAVVSGAAADSVAIDPANPSHVLVSIRDDGFLGTNDDGATWTKLAGPCLADIGTAGPLPIAWDAGNPSDVLVGASGGACASTDGGRTFEDASSGLPASPPSSVLGVLSVSFVPGSATGATLLGLSDAGVFEAASIRGTWRNIQANLVSTQIESIGWSGNTAVLATYGESTVRSTTPIGRGVGASSPTCRASETTSGIRLTWRAPARTGTSAIWGYVAALGRGTLPTWLGSAARTVVLPGRTRAASVWAVTATGAGAPCAATALSG